MRRWPRGLTPQGMGTGFCVSWFHILTSLPAPDLASFSLALAMGRRGYLRPSQHRAEMMVSASLMSLGTFQGSGVLGVGSQPLRARNQAAPTQLLLGILDTQDS